MRYTTIIDCTEWPELYRNENVRLVYLHLVLRSGYHDEDRDKIRTSIRRVAADANVSVAAARHAVMQLEKHGLLKREGSVWTVTKWVMGQNMTTRAQQRAQAQAAAATQAQRERARERELQNIERERQQEAQKLTDEQRAEIQKRIQNGTLSTIARLNRIGKKND